MPQRWTPSTGQCSTIFIRIESGWFDLFQNRPLASTPDSLTIAERMRIAKIYEAYDSMFKKAAETTAKQEEWTPEELAMLEARRLRRIERREELEEERAAIAGRTLKPKPYVANFVLIPSEVES